jgi:hypothetical protein
VARRDELAERINKMPAADRRTIEKIFYLSYQEVKIVI